ncbi:MAG: YvcK family protein [Firmicutes bacterium]|nr:YvcK family protein [Bacillota bacterium]
MEQKVVAIGGGTGLSTLLAGLKRYPVFPIAVVTVGDNGGSSGRLREDFGMPPPGDIRNVLVALSELAPNVEQLLQHRFQGPGALRGHAVGNLLLAALQEETGDFPAAVAELSSVLRVHGRVLPVSAEAYTLCAELEDHRTVVGESQITAAGGRIARIWLTPSVRALPAVLEALAEADMIVLGPGSLFTSVLPNLLVSGVADAILHSNARRKVYVCNVMTQPGETDGFTASDHVAALEHYVGPIVDTVVLSSGSLPEEVLVRYAAEGSYPVVADVARLTARGYRVAMEELLSRDGFARHDPVKLAALLWKLAGEKDR